MSLRAYIYLGLVMMVPVVVQAATPPTVVAKDINPVIQNYCTDCHDAESKKGGLDLTALKFQLDDPKAFATWVKVHDAVRDGEMPPPKKDQPSAKDKGAFMKAIAESLTAEDKAKEAVAGRSVWRRLNRYEYENSLRDLLGAPWLQVKEMLPEDGESHRFNKVGEALDVSHVQLARYLQAADYALHEVLLAQAMRPPTTTNRYYAREQSSMTGKMKFSEFNRSPERATFALLGYKAQADVYAGTAPVTVGKSNPAVREQEAMGVVASAYEPLEIKFNRFTAPVAGNYKLRISAYTFWAGPLSEKRWWTPDRTNTFVGRRSEPVEVYAETPPRLLRKLGGFDAQITPNTYEIDAWLLKGETVRPDPVRLFRSRPPAYHNPLATKEGQPGVAYRWLEVVGPIYDDKLTKTQKLLFGNLPVKYEGKGNVSVEAKNPKADAERLLRSFMAQAYRRPVEEVDVQRFLQVIHHALDSGSKFVDAMVAGYSGVLCSPGFVTLEEKPGKLDDYAIASRLSYYLWNSAPDTELRSLAAQGKLHDREVLKAQTDRLLRSPKSRQFVDSFLDYWLDLRKAGATSPDATLYPDYYLDDALVENSVEESQLFFAELLKQDLPARNIVKSDFVMVNERLAQHYGLRPVKGINLRRVTLPRDSVRGGLMTQASVLKVTANGTTTSPVLRGAWIMERIIGKPPPPPPASVPAIEPDTRGAVTIRQQLEKHRALPTCAGCHTKIDPAGFALENFDVLGGWREQYRGLGEKETQVPGFGKNGQPFTFHLAQPVDASGELPGGGPFKDIQELKTLLLKNERQIARNLASQMVVYSTGAAVRFGDRPEVEEILDRASAGDYGVRSLVHAIVQSDLFLNK